MAACLGHFINLKPSFNSVLFFEMWKVFHMSIIVQDLPGRFFKPHLTYSHKFFFSSMKRYLFPALSYRHTHTQNQAQNHSSDEPLIVMCIVVFVRRSFENYSPFFSEKNMELGRSGFQHLLSHSQTYLTLCKLLNLSKFNSLNLK